MLVTQIKPASSFPAHTGAKIAVTSSVSVMINCESQFLTGSQPAPLAKRNNVDAKNAVIHQPIVPFLAAAREAVRGSQQERCRRQKRQRYPGNAKADTYKTSCKVDSCLESRLHSTTSPTPRRPERLRGTQSVSG